MANSKRFPEERRLEILEQVRIRPVVKAEELAERFGVSVETIRRDLLALQRQGLVRKVYGGAMGTTPRSFEPPFEHRRMLMRDEKRAMGRVAASLVERGETVIFDVGTSVAEVARHLSPHYRGRILTNSLLVASELAGRAGVEVLASGGRVRAGDLACSGPPTEQFFSEFYADKAFLGSGGMDYEAGLTDYYPEEVAVRRLIIQRATQTYVLADSSKVGQIAVQKVCALDALTGLVTDEAADPEEIAQLEQAGINVFIAPMDAVERRAG